MTNCGRMTYKVPCAQPTICKVSQASGYIITNSNIETDGACVYNAHFRQWSFYINLSELWRQRSTNGRCGLYAEAGTFGRRTPMPSMLTSLFEYKLSSSTYSRASWCWLG